MFSSIYAQNVAVGVSGADSGIPRARALAPSNTHRSGGPRHRRLASFAVTRIVAEEVLTSSEPSPDRKTEIPLTGVAMGESPRWHENRLSFSDWGAQEILAVDTNGKSEVTVRVPFGLPFCIDWLPDGRLLVVSGREGRLLRRESDGSLVTHADLPGPAGAFWNEIVLDGRGNIYVNGGAGIVLLSPNGSPSQVAEGFAFPNGMAIHA